jgi:uncharacterized protein (DUF983 family)
MKLTSQCPSCSGKLTLWHGFKAQTPLRIKCPKCKTMLLATGAGFPLTLVMIGIIVLGIALSWQISARTATPGGMLHFAAAFTLFALLGDLAFIVIVFSYARLEALTDHKTQKEVPRRSDVSFSDRQREKERQENERRAKNSTEPGTEAQKRLPDTGAGKENGDTGKP